MNGKTIEQTYVKVNQHQHVLEKPGMYIGEIKQTTDNLWVSENGKMTKKEVSYSSGFLKIFDEILVNALDHSKRDPTVSTIKIDIEPKEGKVSVFNNGEGIPVEQHPEHKKYIPELIFGDLLTSSNYDKNEERTWGGTNGLGAKCVAPDTVIRTTKAFFKKASELSVGDKIYGEDMKEVNVLNTATGYGRMYRITDTKGEFYDVNDNHLLTLLFVGKVETAEYQRVIENSTYVSDKIFDISVKNYLELDTKTRSTLHGIDAFYKSLGAISVRYLGLGRYICLRVDGTHRFLVNDLTLTHNCTNIYSTKFIVETADGKHSFYQSYTKNMYNRTIPLIKKSTKKYTKITFYPDFERFEMKEIDDAMLSIMHKRVYDLIATTSKKVSVYLNGTKVEQKSFREYISLFPVDQENVFASQYISDDGKYQWDVAICPSEHYEQISFVNGIATTKGGKHVDYIVSLVLKKLCSMIESKRKQTIRPSALKDRMMIFVSCTIPNPTFSSQSKEELTTNQKFFGCKPELPDTFIAKLYKSKITDDAIAISNLKLDKEMTKTDGKKKSRITGIPKLDDAGYAGTRKSQECTLILTEGDSAKSSAIAGVSALPNGRDYYGIMPLRGKCISEDTEVLLWNGSKKLAKDILLGDELIGDDGTKRTVLTLFTGNSPLYEVSQDRGEKYIVNENHILSLSLSGQHKIFWEASRGAWRTLYWCDTSKTVKLKTFSVNNIITCKECNQKLTSNSLYKHYKRKHCSLKYPRQNIPLDMNNPKILEQFENATKFITDTPFYPIIDVEISDYMKIPQGLRRRLHGLRGECVKWEKKDILLDPYILGLWLGDGSSSGYGYACFAEKDPELINYIKKWGVENDADIKKSGKHKCTYNFSSIENFRKKYQAPLKKILEKYNLVNNKHIPQDYLINSQDIRLKVLAGIIDTDGYIHKDGRIEIAQSVKHEKLVNDIVYLARSLGFFVSKRNKIASYSYRDKLKHSDAIIIMISGETSCIPTLLPRKQTQNMKYNVKNSTGPLTIKTLENGNYVGIGIDGNNRFLINDFTITHNCLNVREATPQQILKNEEITNIKKIMGLVQGKEYKDTSELRYGRILIFSDADEDGAHIRALVVNVFAHWWPELLQMDGFLNSLRSPIVKAKPTSSNTRKPTLEFFTLREYNDYIQSHSMDGYKVKYYKGLGTLETPEVKDCFKKIKENTVKFVDVDSKESHKALKLAFEKSQADNRKSWLQSFDSSAEIDDGILDNKMSYNDLVHKELIHFSLADVKRSIPSVVDGLKPSQRKALYGCFKKFNSKNEEIKVVQLANYIAENTAYHHGDASMNSTVTSMAFNFVGSNNMNLLEPIGQFGTRIQGGKDTAQPRYIFTRLEKHTFDLFPSADFPVLKYIEDDGQIVEPEYYTPVLPMVLVNGALGIGTGYSTFVAQYNPKELLDCVKMKIASKNKCVYPTLKPWYKNFTGEIVDEGEGRWGIYGKIKKDTKTKCIHITELPVGTWTQDYISHLEKLIEDSGSGVNYYKNLSDESRINIQVYFTTTELFDKDQALYKLLKLYTTISLNNMHLFNSHGKIQKYNNIYEIIDEFVEVRLETNKKRKAYLLKDLEAQLKLYSARFMFVNDILEDKIKAFRVSKEDIIKQLQKLKYSKQDGNFNYLLNMPIHSFSKETLEELKQKCLSTREAVKSLESKTAEDIYTEDILKLKLQ